MKFPPSIWSTGPSVMEASENTGVGHKGRFYLTKHIWVPQEPVENLNLKMSDVILRRMPDYVNYICPQFTHTHVNFQRIPCVDTSNPFVAREIPAPDESMVVIRFAQPKGIDFPYLLNMINDSFMSRANTIVVPGGKMELAMQLIFTPFVWRMMERRKRALGGA